MKVAAVLLSAPLILEFVFAPVNLWTGRTMDNFVRFTGYPPAVATKVFAPIKVATAVLLVAGLFVTGLSVAGAGLALAVSAVYLIRLLAPGRRDVTGLAGFILFGLLSAGLLVVQLVA